jgi:hypothetical protein
LIYNFVLDFFQHSFYISLAFWRQLMETRVTKIPKVLVRADKIIQITEHHGGYVGGKCICCDATGWLSDYEYGLPFGVVPGKGLTHAKQCVMNTVLDQNGKFRPAT